MRSRSTLRARSLYNDRINRNSPGLIPSNGACYPCAGAMLFLLKMMTTMIDHRRHVHDFCLLMGAGTSSTCSTVCGRTSP